jgi:hypothetical protein
VDCLRGWWAEDEQALVVTLRSWDDAEHRLESSVMDLSVGRRGVYEDGNLVIEYYLPAGEAIHFYTAVRPEHEVDIVVIKL